MEDQKSYLAQDYTTHEWQHWNSQPRFSLKNHATYPTVANKK